MFLYPGKRKGYFLIFSLWLFFLLSLFCLGLAFRTFIAVKKTKFFLNRARVFYLAVSGINLAKQVLKRDAVDVDHLHEEWGDLMEEEMVFSSPKREGKLSVKIEDESARININKVDAAILQKLFEARDIENPQGKVDCILDYIDRDSLERGPEELGCEDKKNVKNGDLSLIEELLLVKNISREDYERVKDLVTVFVNDGKVNINTAGRELLDVLIDDPLKKEAVFEVMSGPNLIEGDDDDGYYGEGGEDMPKELEGMFKTVSDSFRIISEAEIEGARKKITCVINRNSAKTLYWYEE